MCFGEYIDIGDSCIECMGCVCGLCAMGDRSDMCGMWLMRVCVVSYK